MQISREQVEERLAELRASLARQQQLAAQAQANVHAFEGAVQDCEHWLGVLDTEPAPAPEQP